jgi:hypothetical protein
MTQLEFIELVKIVLKSPEGSQVMDILRAAYLNRSSFRPGIDSLELAFREGQRDVILYLDELLKCDLNKIVGENGTYE